MSDITPPIQFPADRIIRHRGLEPEVLDTACLDIPVNSVLQAAMEANLQHVMIVGYLPNGDEFFASSVASAPECLWMLECAKAELLLGAGS